jgi:hypothetical protein
MWIYTILKKMDIVIIDVVVTFVKLEMHMDLRQIYLILLQIKDSWCENEDSIYLQSYYETTDVTVINEVYKYYSKYIKLIELCGNCNKYDILYESCSNNGNYSSTKITSTFEKKDILEIKNIHLCSNCYMWFICQNQQYLNNFNLVNPIKFFWIDVVKNYLYDIIEFDDENKKYLFS